MIAGLVLAAGASRRLGRPKQLLPLGGRPLVIWPIEALKAAGVRRVTVVIGHEAATMQEALAGVDVTVVVNAAYREGMSTSLRAGLAVLDAAVEAALVVTSDQPLIGAGHLALLAETFRSTGKPIVATEYGTFRGVPMLLGRDTWPLAAGIAGDRGARALLAAYPDLCTTVPASDPAEALDVDTEDQYQALLQEYTRRAACESRVP